MTTDSVGQDYAILKVDGKTNLPSLPLGSSDGVVVGSDAAIIGFPFSAITLEDRHVSVKFCLSVTITASDLETVPVAGTKKIGPRDVAVQADTKVNVVYFQGPSVKGISGSPIISRDTGRVIGIVTLKLTGITPALNNLRERGKNTGIAFSGIGDPGLAFGQVIDVMDEQLANGLGAATGIDDPAHALKKPSTTTNASIRKSESRCLCLLNPAPHFRGATRNCCSTLFWGFRCKPAEKEFLGQAADHAFGGAKGEVPEHQACPAIRLGIIGVRNGSRCQVATQA